MDDLEVLSAPSAGQYKLRSVVEEETFVRLHNA